MKFIDQLLKKNLFETNQKEKKKFFSKNLNLLTKFHFKNSTNYRKILSFLDYDHTKTYEISKIPFIPVRLFKNFDLLSIKKEKVLKILNSSGTSGNQMSKIFLDKENALNQFKVLQKIMNNILGKDRLPMLIIDKKINNLNRNNFSARIAAINGFSIFGKNHTYLLNKNDEIDYYLLNDFLKKNKGKKFFIFGFTSLIYKNLIKKMLKKKIIFDFNNGILLHGGGWKKLEDIKISNKIFKEKLNKKLNIRNIHNYYGLIEQTGSIFIECKCGYYVASDFSEVLVRDKNFSSLNVGKKGFLQLMSLLPTSYPGQNILTEDIGELIDEKLCCCNMRGTKFLVHGRLPKAEIRGCSDI